MKCDICNGKVEQTFLKKIEGTYIRKNGKRKVVCRNCQQGKTKEEILEQL